MGQLRACWCTRFRNPPVFLLSLSGREYNRVYSTEFALATSPPRRPWLRPSRFLSLAQAPRRQWTRAAAQRDVALLLPLRLSRVIHYARSSVFACLLPTARLLTVRGEQWTWDVVGRRRRGTLLSPSSLLHPLSLSLSALGTAVIRDQF